MAKQSAHLLRTIVEGMFNFSAYKGGHLSYVNQYDPNPTIIVDLISTIDVRRAIQDLWDRGELSKQEIQMLNYVMADGRLSRRDISGLLQKDEGLFIDQRTISRRLESAYFKIAKYLGFEYADGRIYRMIAKKRGRPYPYILSDQEIADIQMVWERI
jgi:hypothetical protein